MLKGEVIFFCVVVYTSVIINLDGGALPPILDKLEESLGVKPAEQGLLGGIVYIGLTLACPFVAIFVQRYPIRLILPTSVAVNAFFCFLFGISPNVHYAYIARTGVGFTQALFVVYCPVWTDVHAPRRYATTWMSVIQSSCPLGIMLGYCISGVMAQVLGLSWRLIFIFQSFCLIPSVVFFLFSPTHLLTVKPSELDKENMIDGIEKSDDPAPAVVRLRSRSTAAVVLDSISHTGRPTFSQVPYLEVDEATPQVDANTCVATLSVPGTTPPTLAAPAPTNPSSSATNSPHYVPGKSLNRKVSLASFIHDEGGEYHMTMMQQIKGLWASKIFVFVVLALSSLYFVVTTIQFWVTQYLIIVIKAERSLVVASFASSAITAPTLGVIIGGLVIDKMGGYKKYRTCLSILTVFAIFAFVSSVPCGFITDFPTIIGLLWMSLFWGGAILSPATGMVISAVPPPMMTFASSISMMFYTLMGYAAGPLVTGLVYEYFGLIWCFRFGLLYGIFGVIFLFMALVVAWRNEKYAPEVELSVDHNLERIHELEIL